ncbi:hypothetical protein [Vibrio crassostreae]|uniref:hypothetical protein n=1 Tax=Vibrio crassostreae TaxID=246167 RepID=UPI001B313411|nr:hypothetical protein [Vibrio crassostreae]
MKLEDIKHYLLSEKTINNIAATKKWSYHGTDIIELFEELGEEEAYADSVMRKRIIKKYLTEKTKEIHQDFQEESPRKLYRAVYVESIESIKDELGLYWSSRCDTEPCVQNDDKKEVVLSVDFDPSIVDWKQTLLSRIDFIHGDREKEFHLVNGITASDVRNLSIDVR